MTAKEKKRLFEDEMERKEQVLLSFHGTEGYDVYNPSIPFWWKGKEYIFGRVEKRNKWASSYARLYERTAKDEWTAVSDAMTYPLEDLSPSHKNRQ